MFARSRFQIGPSKQFQNNRSLALRRPPSCARQRRRFRRLLSGAPGSFRSPGIGSLCVGHAFPPSEHFLYKCSQRAVQRNSGPGEMKLRLIPLALAIAIGSQPAPVSQQTLIGKPVGSLSLLDLDGRTARYSPAERRVAVVVFISNRCPMSNAFNYRLNELYKDFKSQVQFLVVNSNANESLDEVRHHSQEMGYDFMVYKDLNNTVADLLGAQATPE